MMSRAPFFCPPFFCQPPVTRPSPNTSHLLRQLLAPNHAQSCAYGVRDLSQMPRQARERVGPGGCSGPGLPRSTTPHPRSLSMLALREK